MDDLDLPGLDLRSALLDFSAINEVTSSTAITLLNRPDLLKLLLLLTHPLRPHLDLAPWDNNNASVLPATRLAAMEPMAKPPGLPLKAVKLGSSATNEEATFTVSKRIL